MYCIHVWKSSQSATAATVTSDRQFRELCWNVFNECLCDVIYDEERGSHWTSIIRMILKDIPLGKAVQIKPLLKHKGQVRTDVFWYYIPVIHHLLAKMKSISKPQRCDDLPPSLSDASKLSTMILTCFIFKLKQSLHGLSDFIESVESEHGCLNIVCLKHKICEDESIWFEDSPHRPSHSIMKPSMITTFVANSDNNDNNDNDGSDGSFRFYRIATIISVFREKFGCPRQGSLVPQSRGIIQFDGEMIQYTALEGLQEFSHLWVIFVFSQNTHLQSGENSRLRKHKVFPPRMSGQSCGIYASRTPHRFNPIGLSQVRIDRVCLKSRRVFISGLDLVHGTPVLDVKPVLISDWRDCCIQDCRTINDTSSLSDDSRLSISERGFPDFKVPQPFQEHTQRPFSVSLTEQSLADLKECISHCELYSERELDEVRCSIIDVLSLDIRSAHSKKKFQDPPVLNAFQFDNLVVSFSTFIRGPNPMIVVVRIQTIEQVSDYLPLNSSKWFEHTKSILFDRETYRWEQCLALLHH